MPFVLYGINPVREALTVRPGDIHALYLARERQEAHTREILSLAGRHGVPVKEVERRELAKLAKTASHQGIVAPAEPYPYRTVEDIVGCWRESGTRLLLLVLDGIQDPQNLGSLVRTGHLFGALGVVVPKDRAANVTPTVAKASAGAIEHTAIAKVVNVAATLDGLKKEGVWIAGACADGDTSLYDLDGTLDLALVIGSEGKGIRPLVRKKCDFAVTIPMEGKIGSLNASVAGAVALAEIARQRRAAGGLS
jgi:23S rRNA (guanosine2251-2'-O)-methyltransferase